MARTATVQTDPDGVPSIAVSGGTEHEQHDDLFVFHGWDTPMERNMRGGTLTSWSTQTPSQIWDELQRSDPGEVPVWVLWDKGENSYVSGWILDMLLRFVRHPPY